MFRLSSLAGALALYATVPQAVAAPDDAAGAPAPAVEVIVASDPFKRWDDTRWRVDAQMVLPFPVALYAAKNSELQVVAVDVRLVAHCQLGENVGPRVKEVDCRIEQAALTAAPWQRQLGEPQRKALEDNRAALEGVTVRLQAVSDGRVNNLTLVGESEWYRRTQVRDENLRQILWGAFSGFDLAMPRNGIRVGEEFYEKTSRMWWMPSFRALDAGTGVPSPIALDRRSGSTAPGLSEPMTASEGFNGGGAAPDASASRSVSALSTPMSPDGAAARRPSDIASLVAPSAMGRGAMVHRVDRYKGRYLLQSAGEGTVDLGRDVSLTYRGRATSVGVVLPYDGVLSERAWTVDLAPTSSNVLSDGVQGWPYRLAGTLRMLAADEVSEVGASAIVAPPGVEDRGQLPPWPALL